jgi:hypothetical protein
MTEFPALREALVAAAARRRRRRLLTGAAMPAFAVCAAVVAEISLPGSAPEREQVARPPADPLEQAFAVFRRAQRPSDVLPSTRGGRQEIDRARTRLLGQGGPTRFYAVPTTIDGIPALCLAAVRREVGAAWACKPVSEAVTEGTPLMMWSGRATGVLLPDSSTDLRFIFASGVGSVTARNNFSISTNPQESAIGASWTGASGKRYILHTARQPKPVRPPDSCPRRLDPLPDDALERANRAALIAVDRYFPKASRAVVAGAAEGPRDIVPCSPAIADRSVVVGLRLTPAAEGRLLLGMINGRMRVYYGLE